MPIWCITASAGSKAGLPHPYEKTVIDAEMIRQWADCLKPIDVSDGELALDAIRDVAPGGHFFGSAHTLERYEKAFYQPMISDWRNFETWQEDGAKTATERAHDVWQKLLASNMKRQPMDAAVDEALQDYMRAPEARTHGDAGVIVPSVLMARRRARERILRSLSSGHGSEWRKSGHRVSRRLRRRSRD